MLPWHSHGMQLLNIMFPTHSLIVFSLGIKGWHWQSSVQLQLFKEQRERQGRIATAKLAGMGVQYALLLVILALCCVGSCRLTGRRW